ncbi:MAG TPA: adenosylhomocysteinase [Candidatus Limnocylindrales bacterium]|nr:adenosylhomocysteinase [Candidatus Limnocylindrales bacterium]
MTVSPTPAAAPSPVTFDSLSPSIVADPSLAGQGEWRVAWARDHMPVLARLRAEMERDRPLAGHRIGMCLHVEAKTAVLVETLLAGGAEIAWTGSPNTTDDGVAAAMTSRPGLRIYAAKADDMAAHHAHIARVLASDPDMLLDNGADLIAGTVEAADSRVFAATEETTSGRLRLTGELQGRVPYPVIVINDSPIKLSFESERGIGPATVDGFFRATNTFVAGKTFAVVGFGWCGRSLARTLRALGAVVLVVEIDPIRALEAAYEGMLVTTIEKAAARADTIITVTGRPGVLRREHLSLLKDGAMLGNMGHFSTEIDTAALREIATATEQVNTHVEAFDLPNGRRVNLLARGEMLNLSAATGHQIEVMDLGFALQAHSMRILATDAASYAPGYQPVPEHVNRAIAEHGLRTMSTVDLDGA